MSRSHWTARTIVVRSAGAAACALLLTAGSAQAAAISLNGPNILVNGDFEASSAPNMGDNVGPLNNDQGNQPWVSWGPTAINVVKVDGPGGPAYPNGPQSDASNAAAGVQRRYVALTVPEGAGLWQSFTASCTGQVRARASFSRRPPYDNTNLGSYPGGIVLIRKTPIPNSYSGPVIAQGIGMVTMPNVWVEVSAAGNVTAGEHYFVEIQPIKTNVDQASVNYTNLQCVPLSQSTGAAVLNSFVLTPPPAPVDTLSNGGFEANPPPSLGNNLVSSIPAWTTTPAGVLRNVVRVDGQGPFDYTAGPQMDASGVGGLRHYLRLNTQGGGQIYQSFTARCSGQATVRGYFSSSRGPTGQSVAGNGAITLRSGQGVGGTLLGQATVVNLANANVWMQRAATASLVQGQEYTVVVTIDGNLNFDEASLAYPTSCPVAAGTGPG